MTDLNKLRSEFESDLADHLIERDANGFYINDEIQNNWEKCLLKAQIKELKAELEKAKAQAVPAWISVEVGVPVKFGTRVKIKRKSWDEEDNLILVVSEATYDKDSDFCELSNRTHEYETWFDHELKKYLEEDEITHWAPLDKSESGAEG